ncbi:MAG: sulfurtransferase [Jatrophihabitantaceae bacterium]
MDHDSRRALISVDDLVNDIVTDLAAGPSAGELAGDSIGIVAGAGPVLLDVRWQLGGPSQHPQYLAGHLPGARWCDLDADLADPPGPGGRHPLPNPARLQARLQAWGIDDDTEVICYDGGNSIAAARAWWVLRWAGLARVRVLDGGFAAWQAANGQVQVEVPAPRPGTVQVRPGSLPTLDADAAAGWASQGRLVDVRTPERFLGEQEPIDPVAGRIPGAVNLPTAGNLQPSGAFASGSALRDRFSGLPAGQPVGVYCGSGVTAAHTALAMHLVGIDAVLYPGSWSEWITDPARPIAAGRPD